MALKFMYITNSSQIAETIEQLGVDRIFVDLETIGKAERQWNMNTVRSSHTFSDIEAIRKVLAKAQLMVRCNPIHEKSADYLSTEEEIDRIIQCGADLIMLPYFKTVEEVKRFLYAVDGRAKTFPLVETPEAVAHIDDILALDGIDELYIGLNDLSIGYRMSFMFEPLADGTVDRLAQKIRAKNIPFGFGGIASLGNGKLPSKYVIKEMIRLGADSVILSRSFCNAASYQNPDEIKALFDTGIREIREYEETCEKSPEALWDNHQKVIALVRKIAGETE